MSQRILKFFSLWSVQWILLSVLTWIGLSIAFEIYAWKNPRTYGFMGDETPYGFERMFSGLLFLIFLLANAVVVSFHCRKSQTLKASFLKFLLVGLIQTIIFLVVFFGLFTPLLFEAFSAA
jgi:putative flippase GtrA